MHVRALLQGAGGDEWRAGIVDALIVRQRMDGQKLASMPCPREAPQEWEALWRSHLAAWGRLVKPVLSLAGGPLPISGRPRELARLRCRGQRT